MKTNVKVLDCTIRDGGLVNNWDFDVDFVRDLYDSLNAAGVDYMEIGYKNSPKLVDTEGVGPWRFCEDDFIREVIPEKKNTKLSAIVDIGRVEVDDILPCEESSIDLIRVACYLKDIDKAIDLVEAFNKLGYETSINIMAVSNSLGLGLNEALKKVNESPVDMAYIVDSYGSLYNKDIQYLIETFKKYAPNKKLGIHTHNNLQMAFSNTIFSYEQGVEFLDTSIFGMGRGAGNCPTELILGYLNSTKYDVRPILRVIENRLLPLREKLEWGYNTAYAITGLFNEHPRSAIAIRKSNAKNNFLGFYDKLSSVETHEDIK
ncbi:4-hydroxy 2-oxovalerate aldolase [Salirhabdus euzebyi]|uniref:4-hydroxy 2-oxovalerate aldolase n=1 Tax=Salirhabdus euzebyi TaxID=394506 RepID=A0A841Q2V9_9BACI|nr:aldolase catalytic domain-containing protein [Salirhabdus euzebyi]MBB6451668.1 4-hydroxy 2-oxovalerate aldolase [Salirhabdus euzebyi]